MSINETPLRIGIAGLGTVGAGVVKVLQTHAETLNQKTGRTFQIVAVSARDKAKDRGIDLSGYDWVDHPLDLCARDDIDVVIELIGGASGAAYDVVKKALDYKKHVITANKALLAHHGADLARRAEDAGVALLYEAAVAGGIPAIKVLREGLVANDIKSIYGILNGTCNYILTAMRRTGKDFDEILTEAQSKGYAEADPAFDIDGVDAGHKIALLAALGFGKALRFDDIDLRGIRDIRAVDIEMAQAWGHRIKLLGMAARGLSGELSVQVAPCLLPVDHPLASVEDVYNAVFVDTDFAGQSLITGRGAGAGPTASAVVADVVDLALGHVRPVFGRSAQGLGFSALANIEETVARFYLRLIVLDQPGVLADVAAILRDHNISIESLVQPARDPDQPVPVVMMLHESRYGDVVGACAAIGHLESVVSSPCFIRVIGRPVR